MKNTDKGIALLMTLWILVLLSVMAMGLALSTRESSASTRNFKEETIAYYSALSGYEEAVSYLISDKDPATDTLNKDNVLVLDNGILPISGEKTYGDNTVDIKITDEDSKLNINILNNDLLMRLFTSTGIPDDSIQELVDSLIDWKDPDNLHHLSGAEDEYYGSLETPYKAKNKPLDVVEELLLIKGFKHEYLYGGEAVSGIYPIITTYSTSVNINTASGQVLGLIGLSAADIEFIMKQREAATAGLRVIPVSAPKSGIILTTSSSTFRIEIRASLPGSAQALKITSIVKREGSRIKPIYWKEEIENSRS